MQCAVREQELFAEGLRGMRKCLEGKSRVRISRSGGSGGKYGELLTGLALRHP